MRPISTSYRGERASPPATDLIERELQVGVDGDGQTCGYAAASALDIGPDGLVYGGWYRHLCRWPGPDSVEVLHAFAPHPDKNLLTCRLVRFDSRGRLFHSLGPHGELHMSEDLGKSFRRVCDLGISGSVRGFTEDRSGALYAGAYGRFGPTSLFKSDDGVEWRRIATWHARHIHDVRVNPHNDRLYVVIGEYAAGWRRDAYTILRSEDGGRTFTRLFQAPRTDGRRAPRPLFLPINFIDDWVVLGSDHPGGENSIVRFEDTGAGTQFELETVAVIPDAEVLDERTGRRQVSFFCFIERCGGVLYAGARGAVRSYLMRSADGESWSLQEDAPPRCFLAASRSGGGERLAVAKVPSAAVLHAPVTGGH